MLKQKTMKRNLQLGMYLLCTIGGLWQGSPKATAQPRYNMQQLQREKLDRGVVAVRDDSGHVMVSWRLLINDAKNEKFDIFRNGVRLNHTSMANGGTCYMDMHPLATDATYIVKKSNSVQKTVDISGKYTLKADAPCGYIPIQVKKPEDGTTPDGRTYTYSANDASVGDVDGDGQYEIILKWDPSNSKDNSFDGYSGETILDCYRMNGTQLWRIHLGRNIRSGAHYIPFIVYDLDGDGKAELMVKTADGTTDGKGKVIGDADKDWRNDAGRIITGPEYLTVFNGLTGEAMATVNYIPERGDPMGWGDSRGNRSERYLAAVGYLDGRHPSAIFCRGYYTRTVLAAWDWDGKQLKQHWTFDTNNKQWSDYAGQGNHNLRVADVDGDGKDEITYGSMAVDHDGTGLYNTGMGHGDAIHLIAANPSGKGKLMIWDCHENRRDGSELRDAATGKIIFQIKSNTDVGRAMAADIDPTHPGWEMWSSESKGIRDMEGNVVKPAHPDTTKVNEQQQVPQWGQRPESQQTSQQDSPKDSPQWQRKGGRPWTDNTALFLRGRRLPTNFGIWWDGDELREMLDHNCVSKYNWDNGKMTTLKTFEGCQFNNSTKSNSCLSADLLGDWREEVLTRTVDSKELRLYITTIPTQIRIPCLMEDIPYRLSVAAENVGYNQPPEPGCYIGE